MKAEKRFQKIAKCCAKKTIGLNLINKNHYFSNKFVKKDNVNYKYLLRLYSLVDEYLAGTKEKHDNLPEVIVSFCVVVEKILKIKLYKENPVLVFDNSKIRADDALVAIIRKKEEDIETIKIREVLGRYKLLFQNYFSEDELQVLIDIYNARCNLVHGYKSDEDILSDAENIIKKMGTVWEKISKLVFASFSKNAIKASRSKKLIQKYSEEELEKVLIEEVRKKIESNKYSSVLYSFINPIGINENIYSSMSFGGEVCPRCGSFGFSAENSPTNYDTIIGWGLTNNPTDLYRCQKCNLELTRKEYEIAKKIKDPNYKNKG